MKKIVIIMLILISVSIVFFISYSSCSNPEEVVNDVLLELLVYDYEDIKELEPEEVSDLQKQSMKKLKNNFTDEEFEKLSNRLSQFTSLTIFYQLKCSTEIVEIEYDLRELDNAIVIYYTVHMKLIYEDTNKEDEIIQLEGIVSINDEDKCYKIDKIQHDTRSIKILIP
ncbi:MAG: hypothetical protein JEZ08_22480 [Clostridiales bacterium]|nr:hypothetical protein [Clostridiales bacterium]